MKEKIKDQRNSELNVSRDLFKVRSVIQPVPGLKRKDTLMVPHNDLLSNGPPLDGLKKKIDTRSFEMKETVTIELRSSEWRQEMEVTDHKMMNTEGTEIMLKKLKKDKSKGKEDQGNEQKKKIEVKKMDLIIEEQNEEELELKPKKKKVDNNGMGKGGGAQDQKEPGIQKSTKLPNQKNRSKQRLICGGILLTIFSTFLLLAIYLPTIFFISSAKKAINLIDKIGKSNTNLQLAFLVFTENIIVQDGDNRLQTSNLYSDLSSQVYKLNNEISNLLTDFPNDFSNESLIYTKILFNNLCESLSAENKELSKILSQPRLYERIHFEVWPGVGLYSDPDRNPKEDIECDNIGERG